MQKKEQWTHLAVPERVTNRFFEDGVQDCKTDIWHIDGIQVGSAIGGYANNDSDNYGYKWIHIQVPYSKWFLSLSLVMSDW